MFRLIIRQIVKNYKVILPLVVLWIIGGYYIFQNRFALLSTISRITANIPAAGTQNSHRAYHEYYLPAGKMVEGIRLDLMAKSCRKPIRKPVIEGLYIKPHWLEQLKDWNLSDSDPLRTDQAVIVDGDIYWMQNQETVLEALEIAVKGISYAYEIEPDVSRQEKTIFMPAFIQNLSQAVCDDITGLLAYGDYAEFLEIRAYRSIIKENPEYESMHPHPAERSVLVLEKLKNSENYRNALIHALGARPVHQKTLRSCSGNLNCLSPPDAVRIHDRLLYVSAERQLPQLYLGMGMLLAGSLNEYEQARPYLEEASGHLETEFDARIELAEMYLKTKNPDAAYSQMKQLYRSMTAVQEQSPVYRSMAKRVLEANGKFREADCFSDMAGRYPSSELCLNFQF